MKNRADIRRMQELGKILAHIFKEIEQTIEVGMSTKAVEAHAEEFMKKYNVQSAFKGYRGYPGSICVSVNDEIIHGIPKEEKVIREGDVVSIDIGILKDGYYMDSASTYILGKVQNRIAHLVDTTREALCRGIEQFKVNNCLGDISSAIEQTVTKEGFSVVKEFVGHGIGRSLHEEPAVPNYGRAHEGAVLQEGMVFAIEPMVNEGKDAVNILDDGWTAVTADGTCAAHFEHTVALTEEGPLILTAL